MQYQAQPFIANGLIHPPADREGAFAQVFLRKQQPLLFVWKRVAGALQRDRRSLSASENSKHSASTASSVGYHDANGSSPSKLVDVVEPIVGPIELPLLLMAIAVSEGKCAHFLARKSMALAWCIRPGRARRGDREGFFKKMRPGVRFSRKALTGFSRCSATASKDVPRDKAISNRDGCYLYWFASDT